jgi:hypothetical protein
VAAGRRDRAGLGLKLTILRFGFVLRAFRHLREARFRHLSSNLAVNSSSTPIITPGMDVPDFSLDTYEPTTGSFGRVSLSQLQHLGLWTVLVF